MTKKSAELLKPVLNKSFQQSKWNFDLEDCDKILRVDSPAEISETIVRLLQDQGFDCEELSG
jgi:hypothetical protein